MFHLTKISIGNLISKLLKPKIHLLLLFFSLLLAIALRAQETLSKNYLFLIDQGRDMLGVKGIVFDHHLTLIGPYTSLGGVFQGPIYYYLLSIFTFLSKGDPWTSVLCMLLISIATLLVVYVFMSKFFGKTTALITLFLFCISPEAVAAATYSWNPHPMWLIITTYIFLTYLTISKSPKYHLFLWPVLALSFHFQAALGVFLSLGTFLYFIIFERKNLISKNFFLGLLFGLVFFLPQIIFDLRHNFLMSSSVVDAILGNDRGLFFGKEGTTFNRISDHLSAFYSNYLTSFHYGNLFKKTSQIVLYMTGFILVFSRFNKIFNKNEKRFINLLLTLIFFIFGATLLYPFPIRYWHLTGFQSFYLLLVGVVFGRTVNYKIGKTLLLVFAIISLIYSYQRLDYIYLNPPNDGGLAKIKGKIAALDYIYLDAKDQEFNLLVFTPPVNTDAYDYLVWWYGQKKYGFLPTKEKKGLTYLLMEPDPSKPWSYNGWLETVIVNGDVIKTVNLPSGLIIQKRIF